METIVIGDIHGGLKALTQILSKTGQDNNHRYIFLGDYVDGWSQSADVISYLILFSAEHETIFLKGNHDTWAADWLRGREADPVWLHHGGQATVNSYKEADKALITAHIEFFDSLHDYYTDTENRLFVHAGFTSVRGPEHENNPLTLSWDRTLWELAVAVDPLIPLDSKRYPARLSLFKEIFIGHTPTTHLGEGVPVHAANVWNIDTGAAFKGKLSAMNIDTREIWQSDPLKDLYPDEKGRN